MDYEHRTVRWYWVALFVIYSGFMIYAVLTGNPYLYSHSEYNKAIKSAPDQMAQPVPSPSTQSPLPPSLGPRTHFTRMNPERNGDAPSDITFGKNFFEQSVTPVSEGDFHPTSSAMDENGVYVAGGDVAVAYNLNGEKLWTYQFAGSGDRSIAEILLDHGLTYLIHSTGEIVALNKTTGQLQWNLKLRAETIGPTILTDVYLLIPIKSHPLEGKNPRPAFRWAVVKRTSGELTGFSKPIEAKPFFNVTYAPDLQAWILSSDNKIVAVDPKTFDVMWTQTLTDPIQGPVSVVGTSIFVSSLAGKVLKLDGIKKGRTEWEAEMQRPPASPPSYLPVMNKVSVLDDKGGLQLIDAKFGKPLWRSEIENKNHLTETWSARVKGSVIEENQMDWAHRGWSVWTPCTKNRICIYNPAKGQTIGRITLSGSPVTLPFIKDKTLYFLLDQGSRWALARVEQEKKTDTP